MIEGLSLGTLGIGSGWAIVCLGVVMVFRGDLRTSREAKSQDRQIDSMRGALETKDRTISEFRDVIATSNDLTRAVLDVARERMP